MERGIRVPRNGWHRSGKGVNGIRRATPPRTCAGGHRVLWGDLGGGDFSTPVVAPGAALVGATLARAHRSLAQLA
jgi:hypothetical protein